MKNEKYKILNKISGTEIIEKYLNKTSIKCLSKHFNVDPSVIKKILDINNIFIEKRIYRKYELIEDFFDNIDSEEKAYFLGFLYADGSISKNGYNTCLCLSNKDKEILIKLGNLIFPKFINEYIIDRPSKQHPGKIYSTLNFNSMKINSQLQKIGCTSAKSLTLKFPNELKNNMQRHFIRGYFDGDGSITKKCKILTITSTLDFCQNVKDIINKYIDINLQIYKYNNIYRLTTHGRNQVIKLYNWLYDDSNIYLNRKYDIFQSIINEKTKYFPNKLIINFNKLYNEGMSYSNISKIYNCSASGVKKAIKKYKISNVTNTVLEVINPAGNNPAFDVTPTDGGLTAPATSLVIKRLS